MQSQVHKLDLKLCALHFASLAQAHQSRGIVIAVMLLDGGLGRFRVVVPIVATEIVGSLCRPNFGV